MQLTTPLTALLLALSTAPALVLSQGYAETCGQFSLVPNEHTMQARCGDGKGGYRTSQEDLNLCIINSHGNLLAQNDGGFGASASGCYADGTYLRCICGGTTNCEIDLNSFVTNEGGYLWCFGHRGT